MLLLILIAVPAKEPALVRILKAMVMEMVLVAVVMISLASTSLPLAFPFPVEGLTSASQAFVEDGFVDGEVPDEVSEASRNISAQPGDAADLVLTEKAEVKDSHGGHGDVLAAMSCSIIISAMEAMEVSGGARLLCRGDVWTFFFPFPFNCSCSCSSCRCSCCCRIFCSKLRHARVHRALASAAPRSIARSLAALDSVFVFSVRKTVIEKRTKNSTSSS
jgi:hypothetical protein